LLIVQEGLLFIINGAANQFASTGGASTSLARRRKVNTCLFSSFKDVLILFTLNGGFGAVGRAESNIVCHR
jgi:hypothetical protein